MTKKKELSCESCLYPLLIDAKVYARQSGVIISVIGCLHDPANVQQTSSKCTQNTCELLEVCWTSAGSLLEVCWTFAAICYNGAGRLLDVCWIE